MKKFGSIKASAVFFGIIAVILASIAMFLHISNLKIMHGIQSSDLPCEERIHSAPIRMDYNYPRVIASQSESFCLYNRGYSNGVLIGITKDRLKVVEQVHSVTNAGDGIAYLTYDGYLFFYLDGHNTLIDDSVDSVCWNGEMLLYHDASTGSVISWDGTSATEITQIFPERMATMLSNDKYIVAVSNFGDCAFYRYNTDEWQEIAQYGHNHQNHYVLYGNSLVCVGWYSTGCEVYDLETGIVTAVDLGWDGRENVTTVTSIEYGGAIAVSVESSYLGKVEKYTGTYLISPDTWIARQFNSNFYPVLYNQEGVLYGTDLFSHQVITTTQEP